MAGVHLAGVSRVFPGGVVAVQPLDLEVRDKEFLVLVGPSGCGKTTTLRMIAGLEEVSSGQIRIGQRVVTHTPPKDRDIAMVFQNYALYPHMSVYKNMSFGLQLRHGSSWLKRSLYRVVRPARARQLAETQAWIDRQVRDAARTLAIEHLLHRMPRQLSGGERQRVALGRAIVRHPAAFLFDEPLSNLDARLRIEMRRELRQLHRRLEATMIYVTHDQVEALTLGDRVVVMNQGAIHQVGSPVEVYDRPQDRFVAGFIGSPPMNLLEGALQAEGEELRFQMDGWSMRIDPSLAAQLTGSQDSRVVLGIRAEDVRCSPTGEADAMHAQVVLIEPLGDSLIVHLEVGAPASGGAAATIVSKAEARAKIAPGDQVRVHLDGRRAHLFDVRTGKNLTLAGSAERN